MSSQLARRNHITQQVKIAARRTLCSTGDPQWQE